MNQREVIIAEAVRSPFGRYFGGLSKVRPDDLLGFTLAALAKKVSKLDLNRIDDVIIFNSLTKEHIFRIIDILMKSVMKRLINLGFSLELTEEAKTFLADKGYDQQFGARPLHRAIQKYLEDPLAEEILNMNVKAGDILIAGVDAEQSKLAFTFKSRAEATSPA